MSNRRLLAFVDALATGRRPKRFRAQPEDAEMLRTAIALRAARPGEAAPTEPFVEGLFQRLSEQAKSPSMPEPRPARRLRVRTVLVAAAAAGLLVAGTAVVTEQLHHPAPTSAAAHVPQGSQLRTGTCLLYTSDAADE